MYHARGVKTSARCVTCEAESVSLNGTCSIAQSRPMLRSLYLWACERLYHELAGGYDVISRLVSAGAWLGGGAQRAAAYSGRACWRSVLARGSCLTGRTGRSRGHRVGAFAADTPSPLAAWPRAFRLCRVCRPPQRRCRFLGLLRHGRVHIPCTYIVDPATLAECGSSTAVAGSSSPGCGWRARRTHTPRAAYLLCRPAGCGIGPDCRSCRRRRLGWPGATNLWAGQRFLS